MDIKELEAIASLMKANELTRLELEEKGIKLKLERMPMMPPPPPPRDGMPREAAAPAPQIKSAPADELKPAESFSTIVCPTVGVYYSAPSPESEPFVKVGDRVSKGDVVCIIEAMKLMNEITSEYDGTVAEICVGNGQVVEYGQPLFKIK